MTLLEEQLQTFRDPYEEFFNLTGQCVKLNSKYIDEIIDIDVKKFYRDALNARIPFH